jgi:diguanylate cyclase (GGDEF)-like protein
VDSWNWKSLKALLFPGGILFIAVWIILGMRLVTVTPAATSFYYYGAFAVGILLAWRFHSSKLLFGFLYLLLAHRAIEFYSAGSAMASGPGRIAFETVCFLLPLNFLVISLMRERGLGIHAIAPRLGLLFVQAVFVAVICRSGETSAPALFHLEFLPKALFSWSRVPQISIFIFIAALATLASRYFLYRRAAESGLFWALAMTMLALQRNPLHPSAVAYLATAGFILAGSIIETSYALAYQDELTSLPSRRAFNEHALRLDFPVALAVVDIDHFKSFNDTYGHETGDQVLRMVATKLGEVTGGGKAFRTGGEEFCILFPGKTARQVVPHLDLLRKVIEASAFRVRVTPVLVPSQADRRKPAKKTYSRPHPARSGELSVTVSIGIAESRSPAQPMEQILRTADKALYRAKQAGRNRVEVASTSRPAPRRSIRRSIA